MPLPAIEFLSDKTHRAAATTARATRPPSCRSWSQLLMDGRLDLAGVVSQFTDLDGIEAAFERLRRGEGARTVVVVDRESAGLD